MESPQYKHDDGGVFLGRFNYKSPYSQTSLDVDLYYFDDNGIGDPTIMSRWGDQPADNSTGMVFGWTGLSPDMTEARRRAEALGLDVGREQYHAHNMPQRGEIVTYKGLPYTYCGIANPARQGMGVIVKPGYPRSPNNNPRSSQIVPFEDVKDLDDQPIQWFQDIP